MAILSALILLVFHKGERQCGITEMDYISQPKVFYERRWKGLSRIRRKQEYIIFRNFSFLV